MKSALIIYKSKTGFTKKYVDWILEDVKCSVTTLDKAKKSDIDKYDIVIYGAGVHAGHIAGLKKFNKLVDYNKKKVIFFATGAAPNAEEIVNPIIDVNIGSNNADVEFFYMEAGICYENMGFFARGLMRAFSKMLKAKKDKTDIEKGMSEALMTSFDNSKKENIEPLIASLKKYLNNE